MSWTTVDAPAHEWDHRIYSLSPSTPFSSTSWASFRQRDGWIPVRFTSFDDRSAVQILVKRVSRLLVIAWAPGGLLGVIDTQLLTSLLPALKQLYPRTTIYLRVSDYRSHSAEAAGDYASAGWVRCRQTFMSRESLTRSISSADDELRAKYSGNWSRNLRRGEKRCQPSELWIRPDVEEMALMYRNLADYKRTFHPDWRGDPDRLHRLFELFGPHIITTRVTDDGGETLAYRSAVISGSNGFDILAAASAAGRLCYASHVVTHGLLLESARHGCTTYDFAGVDLEKNKGVYDFKRGAGGDYVQHLGEFDIGSHRGISKSMRWVLNHRHRSS
jgi:hypothetical protein